MACILNASTTSGFVHGADTSGVIALQNNGTTYATGNQYGIGLGTAVPSSGIGIAFHATQSASSDANTLDDYEEGTWTPTYTLDSGSVSSVTSSGSYVKIGKQVTLTLSITFGSSSSGAISNITGYPFTAANTAQQAVGAIREDAVTGLMWQLRATTNATQGYLRRYDNGTSLSSGMTFIGTLTYFTA